MHHHANHTSLLDEVILDIGYLDHFNGIWFLTELKVPVGVAIGIDLIGYWCWTPDIPAHRWWCDLKCGWLILHNLSFSGLVPGQVFQPTIITQELSNPLLTFWIQRYHLQSRPSLFVLFTISIAQLSIEKLSQYWMKISKGSHLIFVPAQWQLLRAVKSLVMGKKIFLDQAAGKLLNISHFNINIIRSEVNIHNFSL